MKWVILLVIMISSLACNNNVDVKGQPTLPATTTTTGSSEPSKTDEASAPAEQTDKEPAKEEKATDYCDEYDDECQEPTGEECKEGKICRGLTKEEIIEIVGEPDGIEMWFGKEEWIYVEIFGKEKICRQGWYESVGSECRIIFRDGYVVDQMDLKAKAMDIKNY